MEDIRICFVGDSLTNGTGDVSHLGWLGRVCAAAESEDRKVTHYNLGIRGESSADILRRWEAEVAPRFQNQSDRRLVFAFGNNDTRMTESGINVTVDDAEANARTILSRAMAQYPTLMVGPSPNTDPDHCDRIQTLDAILDSVCKDLGVPYLSVYEGLRGSDVWMREVGLIDGSHPSAGGYAEFAELVMSWPEWWFHK